MNNVLAARVSYMRSTFCVAVAVACLFGLSAVSAASVKVDIEYAQPHNAKVTKQHTYSAMVHNNVSEIPWNSASFCIL
jgi:hypothetical protein